ncbi:MAG: thioredoxin [Bacteroidales bacterium]|nr:thioredoxin [Bacteroidales bacterium]
MAQQVNDSNFDTVVMNGGKPALVDFWAEWCGPCRMVAPLVEQIADEYADRAIVVKVNVDDCPDTAARFGIRNIPTLLYIKNGEVVDKQVGAAPKPTIAAKLDAIL